MPITYDELVDSDEFSALPSSDKNKVLNHYGYDSLPEVSERESQLSGEALKNYQEMGDFKRGLYAGGHQVEAIAGGALGLFGDATGLDKLRDQGFDRYQKSTAEAAKYPGEVEKIEDIGWEFGKAVDWAQGAFGEQIPTLISMAVGGGVLSAGLKKALPSVVKAAVNNKVKKGVALNVAEQQVAKRFTDAGIVMTAGTMEAGGMWGQEAKKHGVENVNALTTSIAGLAAGSLELLGVGGVLSKAMNGMAGTTLKRLGIEGFKGVVREGTTEGAQEVVSILNSKYHDPTVSLTDKESISQILNSIATGALVGGGVSMSTGLLPAAPTPEQADATATELENTTDNDGFKSVKNVVEANEIRQASGVVGQFQGIDEQFAPVGAGNINTASITGTVDDITGGVAVDNLADIQNRARIRTEGKQLQADLGLTPADTKADATEQTEPTREQTVLMNEPLAEEVFRKTSIGEPLTPEEIEYRDAFVADKKRVGKAEALEAKKQAEFIKLSGVQQVPGYTETEVTEQPVFKPSKKEATALADSDPHRQAMEKAKTMGGINIESVKQMFSPETYKELSKAGLFTNDGQQIDEIATQLGYADAKELVTAWEQTALKKDAVSDAIEEQQAEFDIAEDAARIAPVNEQSPEDFKILADGMKSGRYILSDEDIESMGSLSIPQKAELLRINNPIDGKPVEATKKADEKGEAVRGKAPEGEVAGSGAPTAEPGDGGLSDGDIRPVEGGIATGKEQNTVYLGDETPDAPTVSKRRTIETKADGTEGTARDFQNERRDPKKHKTITEQNESLPGNTEAIIDYASDSYVKFKNAIESVAVNKENLRRLFDAAGTDSIIVTANGVEYQISRPERGKNIISLNAAGRKLRKEIRQKYKDDGLLEYDYDKGVTLNVQPTSDVVSSASTNPDQTLEQAAIEHVKLQQELGLAYYDRQAIRKKIKEETLPLLKDNGIGSTWRDSKSESTFWVSRKKTGEEWAEGSKAEYEDIMNEIMSDPETTRDGGEELQTAGVSKLQAMQKKGKDAEAEAEAALPRFSIADDNIPTQVTDNETGKTIDVAEAAQTVYTDGMNLGKFISGMRKALGKAYSKVRSFVRGLFNEVKAFNDRLGEVGAVGEQGQKPVDVKSRNKQTKTPANNSQEIIDKKGQEFLDGITASGLVKFISPDAIQGILDGINARFMTAWHGSPHEVDKFSSDKIGTGEGAQAYGHGLYFAESRDVAEWYRKKLGARGLITKDGNSRYPADNMITGSPMVRALLSLSDDSFKNNKERIADLEKQKKDIKARSDRAIKSGAKPDSLFIRDMREEFENVDEAISLIEDGVALDSSGKLYQVKLAPKEEEYLLWDKPLSEQSKEVMGAFGKIKNKVRLKSLLVGFGGKKALWADDVTYQIKQQQEFHDGSTLYNGLERALGGKAEASQLLSKIGIRGIKYADGATRNKEDQNFNYVIFDDSDVTIEARYSKDGKIEAFTMPDGTIYMVDGNIAEGNAYQTLLHEAGHSHLPAAFTGDRWSGILKTFERHSGKDTATGKAVNEARARVPEGTKPEHVAEEQIMYFITNNANKELPLYKRIIGAIRRALVSVGFPTSMLHPDDMVAMAEGYLAGQGKAVGKSDGVRYSTAATPATRRKLGFMGKIAPYINITEDQKDQIATTLWDRLVPVKRIQGRAKRKLKESQDYLLHRRVAGRKSADEVTLLKDTQIDPLLKTMADADLSIKQVGDYLWADHASERNIQMKRVRAMGFIRNTTNAMTDKEASEFKDMIFDAKHNSELTLAEIDDKRDGYIDVMDSMQGRVQEWEDSLDVQRGKAKTDHALKLLKNAEDRLQMRKNVIDKWEDVKDRLSGLTNEQAETKLDELASPEMKKIAKSWREINENALLKNLEAGEITQGEYDNITRPYKKDVPLYREDQDFETTKAPVGLQSLGSIGSPIKTEYGSTSAVENVIPHIVDRAQAAIERKHRLDGAKILYDMALNNPEMGLSLSKQPTAPAYDNDGNLIRQPKHELDANQWRMKVDGETYILEVDPDDKQGMRFVESLLPKISDLGPILNASRKLNQLLAKLNTTYNPEFVISNFTRDIQIAGVMLEDTEGGEGGQKEVLKGVTGAIKGIYASERGKDSGEWGKWWADMKKNGGKISFLESYETIEDLAKKLETDLAYIKGDKSALKMKGKATLDFIEAMNTSVENGVRLSTYRYLVENGQSKKMAAKNVANLTVDFNRSGKWGPTANSLYMFANAGIIGNARMIQALGKSKKVQKIAAGVVGAGMAQGVLSVLLGGYDDDGESYYDKLRRSNPALFERNMIWMKPGTKGEYIKFPLAYGLNVFYKFGEEISTAVRQPQGYSTMKGAMSMTTTVLNAFNPVASSTIFQTMAPTALDPIIQSGENKNWFGGDLMPAPNPYGMSKPDSERYWNSVNPAAKGISRTLNTLTGGDKIEGGLVDISPATLENVWGTFTGATGRFITDVATLPYKAFTGDAQVRNVPFVRKFTGSTSEYVDGKIYKENVKRVEITDRRYEAADTVSDRRKIKRDSTYNMISVTDTTEKRLNKLRKKLRTAEDSGRESTVERLDKQIREIQRRYNRKFNRLVN